MKKLILDLSLGLQSSIHACLSACYLNPVDSDLALVTKVVMSCFRGYQSSWQRNIFVKHLTCRNFLYILCFVHVCVCTYSNPHKIVLQELKIPSKNHYNFCSITSFYCASSQGTILLEAVLIFSLKIIQLCLQKLPHRHEQNHC